MDTATDLSGHRPPQGGHAREVTDGLPGHGLVQAVPDGEYLSLAEAAAAVQRSEKTLRRLVGKGKVPNYREAAPPYRMFVEMGAVRAAVVDSLAAVPFSVDSADSPRQSGQPPTGQSGHVQTEHVHEPMIEREDNLLHFLQAELDRLRQELGETRTRSRAELEVKEQRIEKLTDDLLSARRDAGKWEQAEEYRKQIYNDYMRLQSELGETRMQLRLLERNPLPPDAETGHEVYVAPRPTHDDRVIEATLAPRRAPFQSTLLWLLLLLIAGGGSLAVYWMTISH